MLKKRLVVLSALLLLCALSACGAGEEENRDAQASAFEAVERFGVGDFTLTLLDGSTLTRGDLEGKAVLIDFWASWCGPCVSELPEFQKLQEHYGDRLIVLAIDVGEKESIVSGFIEENGYSFSVAIDDGTYSGFLSAIPYSILMGPDGGIAMAQLGKVENAFETLSAVIDELLA